MRTNRLLTRTTLLSVVLGLICAGWLFAAADVDPYDQSGVPLEKRPADPNATKIVLVAGHQSHGPGEHEFFAGCALLMKMLEQTRGVAPVMARDGWPKYPQTFEGAKSVVFFMDGGSGHPIINEKHKEHREVVRRLMDQGVGFVNLHYAVEYPKSQSEHILNWLGGYYETNYSTNPHWKAEIKSLPQHPITRGVKPFTLTDEWYFNIRFKPELSGVTPILKATPPDDKRGTAAAREHKGREEILAWAFDRANGGRSFGFTGAHFHKNWGDENFRRLVVNAILWTAKVEVPEGGAPVAMDPAELNRNLDDKRKR